MRDLTRLPGVRRLGLACAGLAVVWVAATVGLWSAVATFVDSVALDGRRPEEVARLLAVAGVAWAVRALVSGAREWLGASTSARVQRELRRRALVGTFGLGPAGLTGERGGELTETLVEGIQRLDGFVARFVPGSVFASVVPLGVFVAVLVLDPLGSLVLALTGPLVVIFLWLVGTLAERASREQWLVLGRLGARFVDTLRGLGTLVVYGRAGDRIALLRGESEAYRTATMRVLRSAFLSGFVLELGATLSTALVAVTVGVRLFEGHLDFQTALLVLLLTPEFYTPLRQLGADHHARMEAAPAWERVTVLLNAPRRRGGMVAPERPSSVRLRDVTVVRDGRPVVSDVTLDLDAGAWTVLVGPSGAGKTSLAHVVLGFLEPEAGAVLVDGQSLATLDAGSWLDRIGYVPERPVLFPGTVRDNLRLARPDVTHAEIEAAARAAEAHAFIERLPDGYDTRLGEDGEGLSGGERARLALARALLKRPAVWVLDEPTSQLDPYTEADLLVTLRRVTSGRPVLLVTHRPALLDATCRVYRVSDGRCRRLETPVAEVSP